MEQQSVCNCACCRRNARSSLELRENHARTLSEMRGSISTLTKKYKATLEAMERAKLESEENRRLSTMAASAAQIHCDEIKNGLQALSLDANELVQLLSDELSSIKKDRDNLRRNQDVLCSKLSSLSQPCSEEKAVLLGQVQDLTRSREVLQVSLDDATSKCSALDGRIAALQEENAQLLAQRDESKAAEAAEVASRCSALEGRIAALQEENAQLLAQRDDSKPPTKHSPPKVDKILRLTRENQQFAVKLAQQENKSKALEATLLLLLECLDRQSDDRGKEDGFIDILDEISHIRTTSDSHEVSELIGKIEHKVEKMLNSMA